MAITTDNAGTAGDPIPYNSYTYPQPGDTYTIATDPAVTWGDRRTTGFIMPTFTTPQSPGCTEAIIILEEAEYELKELLKKTGAVTYYNQDGTVERVDKSHQELIVTALRSTQAALRALLKIG